MKQRIIEIPDKCEGFGRLKMKNKIQYEKWKVENNINNTLPEEEIAIWAWDTCESYYERQSCENCFFSQKFEYHDDVVECEKGVSNHKWGSGRVTNDFSCKYWEERS